MYDGDAGVEAATSGSYAIVVLDIMMPRMSGVEALRRIRATSKVPVLMLTARGDNIDRIVGLDRGADDYVSKPCTPGELVAAWRGRPLDLIGAEFNLFEVLARHAGQLVSKQDISMQAFGRALGRFDRRIDVHISSIRQKLGARTDGQSWIQSVHGMGYQLLRD